MISQASLAMIVFLVCFGLISSDNSNSFKCKYYQQTPNYYKNAVGKMAHLYQEDIDNLQYKGSIQTLKLNQADLQRIRLNTFKGFTNLTHLTIFDSGVEDIEQNAFSHLPNLEYLDLSRNKLSKLFDYMFEDISKLKKLILNNNLIKSIDSSEFSNLTNLRELQIKNNQLQSIYGNTFTGLTNLEIIDLSGNPIGYIQEKSFDSCKSLRQLIVEKPKQLFIKSIWSSPSNFELVIVNSEESIEQLVRKLLQEQNEMSSRAMNRNSQNGSSSTMIIAILVTVVLIVVVAVGIFVYLKKKNNGNAKYEVAEVNNGMFVSFR